MSSQAHFVDWNRQAVVSHYQDVDDEVQQAKSLGIVDLTTLDRIGFKGVGSSRWLTSQQVILPEQVNFSSKQPSGELLARLSWTEYLLLPRPNTASVLIGELNRSWSLDDAKQTYAVPRNDSHCWFVLMGKYAQSVLAKLCAIDFSDAKFVHNQIAQTSVARTNGIVIRQDIKGICGFYILSDVSSSEFLWESILDAMKEFDGQAIGTRALNKIIDN
jgi:sarcosine oxidase subunit gamma